jgi:hypothetical protein
MAKRDLRAHWWLMTCRACGLGVPYATEGARWPGSRTPKGLCRGCGATTRHDVEPYPDGWQEAPEERGR